MEQPAYQPPLGDGWRRRISLSSDPPSYVKARDGFARRLSDAGLLHTQNHWGRTIVFGTLADPLWPVIVAFCAAPALLMAAVFVATGSFASAFVMQCILACGSFVSLRLLGEYPLVNPVHAMVMLFHWWFGFGPTVCGAFWWWKGDLARATGYWADQLTPLLIVSLGLPLYALASRWALRHWKWLQLTVAVPNGPVYEMGALLRLGAVAGLASVMLQLFSASGLQDYDSTNYLGGVKTVTWWLIPLSQASRLVDFALAAACSLLAVPHFRKHTVTKWIACGIILVALQRALVSGSKGLLMLPLFYFLVAFVNWRRRIPWLALVGALFGYLGFVEPFVAEMRIRAEQMHAQTVNDRIRIFSDGLRQFEIGGNNSRNVNVEALFRGIYPLAKLTTEQSSLRQGPWRGESLRDGVSAMLPRAIFPDKADSNMGNFFAKQLGASGADNYIHNVAITIPFEIVGNYGWLAGWLSFAGIGFIWASFVSSVVTTSRMTTHPLTPFVIALGMGIEGSVGQFGNKLKMLLISLFAIYLIFLSFRDHRNA